MSEVLNKLDRCWSYSNGESFYSICLMLMQLLTQIHPDLISGLAKYCSVKEASVPILL